MHKFSGYGHVIIEASLSEPHTYRVVLLILCEYLCTYTVYIYISTYGTYISLVPRIPHATGKRKTGSMRSTVTHGWLIGKKLGEIFLYLPPVLLHLNRLTFSQFNISHSYCGTIAGYGCDTRRVLSFRCMCRSPSARSTRECPSRGGNSRWTRTLTVAIQRYRYSYVEGYLDQQVKLETQQVSYRW